MCSRGGTCHNEADDQVGGGEEKIGQTTRRQIGCVRVTQSAPRTGTNVRE